MQEIQKLFSILNDAPVERLKLIFCTPIYSDVIEVFDYTKSFQEGISFVEQCEEILNVNYSCFDIETADRIHDILIEMHLSFLDRLNKWNEYLQVYDAFVPKHSSTVKCDSRYNAIKKKMVETGKPFGKTVTRNELSNDELTDRIKYLERIINDHIRRYGL